MRAKTVLKTLPMVVLAPLRTVKREHAPPPDPEDYERRTLARSASEATTMARDIPKAYSVGGVGDPWPPLVLAGCDEPLVDGAPDLRGVWQVHRGALKGHIERIEQAGDRVVITTGGLIHDMFADGTLEGGVDDRAEGTGEPIRVAARFEDGRHNLYPGGSGVVAVTRYLDGDEMVWRWGPWKNRLRRLSVPSDAAEERAG